MPHSGTTYLSELINKNTNLANSAFECGILLSKDSPRNFHSISPFYEWLCMPIESGQWGLSPTDRDWACDTDSWVEFYNRLAQTSPAIAQKQLIIDKTPAYCFSLSEVMEKVPSTHVFVCLKNPELLYKSFKRRKVPLHNFLRKLEAFHLSLKTAMSSFEDRIHTVYHEELCKAPSAALKRIFNILDVPYLSSQNKDLNWDRLPPIDPNYNYTLERETIRNYLTNEESLAIGEFVENEAYEYYAI